MASGTFSAVLASRSEPSPAIDHRRGSDDAAMLHRSLIGLPVAASHTRNVATIRLNDFPGRMRRRLATHLLKSALGIEPGEPLADLPCELTTANLALDDDSSDALQFAGAEVPSAKARRSTGLRTAHGARAWELTGGSWTPPASWWIKFQGSQRSSCSGALDPLTAQACR